MMIFRILIATYVMLDVLAEHSITSSENEMDLIIDMLLKNEITEYTDSIENAIDEENIAEPVYSKGVWKCGKCEDVDESRLVYTETYNVEADDEEEDLINLQVGLSLKKISCVIVSPGGGSAVSTVERVSGNCVGWGATLRVHGAAQCDIKVYE